MDNLLQAILELGNDGPADRLVTKDTIIAILRADIRGLESLPDDTIFLVAKSNEGRAHVKKISTYAGIVSEYRTHSES